MLVRDELAEHEDEHDEAENENSRAGIAKQVDEPVGESGGGPGLRHRSRERKHSGDEDHRRPLDASGGLLDRQDPADDDGARGEQAGHGRRGDARREEDDHAAEHDERAPRPFAQRDRLPPHLLRAVDDEYVRVVQVLVECTPGAAQQERVPGREQGLARAVLLAALDGENDEVGRQAERAMRS